MGAFTLPLNHPNDQITYVRDTLRLLNATSPASPEPMRSSVDGSGTWAKLVE